MALGDFLKKDKQAQEELDEARKKRQNEETDARRKFRDDAKVLFDDTIKPAVVDILQELKINGVSAEYGQKNNPVTYADNYGVVSFSVRYKSSLMQMDIVAIGVNNAIEIRVTFEPKPERRINYRFAISEVTRAKIEEVLEEQLARC